MSSSTPSSHVCWNSRSTSSLKSRPQSPPYSPSTHAIRERVPRSPRPERYVYTYSLLAGTAPLQFLISVEPLHGRPAPGQYTFRLSLKVDKVERPLMKPITMNLAVDPRQLEFAVFLFPGKSSLPTGCLYSYRVWLRANGVDHRLFGEDELWVGKDPDFSAIGDASFARLKSVTSSSQVYDGVVGKARVQFIARWYPSSDSVYKYTLEYEANGVGAMIVDEIRLLVQGDPRKVTFLIYTMPVNSIPAGASHRLRVWLKSYIDSPAASVVPFSDSYIYQRIWKTDTFKIGAKLDFGALGSKMIMAFSSDGPRVLSMPTEPLHRSGSSVGSDRDDVEVG